MMDSPPNRQSPSSRASLRTLLIAAFVVCFLAAGGLTAFALTHAAPPQRAQTASVSATHKPTHPPSFSHSGGGGEEDWSINANGYASTLTFWGQPASGLNGTGPQDAWYGEVFGDVVVGYKILQADGTIAVSFLRLPLQSAGYITYFQVYNGVESADQQTMTGTFRVYTGSYSYYFHVYTYSYAEQPQVYNWSATYLPNNPIYGPPAIAYNYRGPRKTPVFRHGDRSGLAAVDLNSCSMLYSVHGAPTQTQMASLDDHGFACPA